MAGRPLRRERMRRNGTIDAHRLATDLYRATQTAEGQWDISTGRGHINEISIPFIELPSGRSGAVSAFSMGDAFDNMRTLMMREGKMPLGLWSGHIRDQITTPIFFAIDDLWEIIRQEKPSDVQEMAAILDLQWPLLVLENPHLFFQGRYGLSTPVPWQPLVQAFAGGA